MHTFRRIACYTALLGVQALVACASTPPQSPVAIAQAWSSALEVGDVGAARALMSTAAQRRAARLPAGPEAPTVGTETVRTARWAQTGVGFKPWGVTRLRSGWRVYGDLMPDTKARTPQAAVVSFMKAVQRRDTDGLWALLPAQQQRVWGQAGQLEGVVGLAAWQRLAAAMNQGRGEMVRSGSNRARYSLPVEGSTTVVVLVREGSAWKVFDLQPVGTYTSVPLESRED